MDNQPATIKEAIILAGGLGTRLREAVPDLPKCMAPVAGRPFLFYVINYLRSQGIGKFIFSLGYKHEVIEEYLNSHFASLSYQIVVEEEPLGTGGAIRFACEKVTEKNVLVANGDTLFRINAEKLAAVHDTHNADATLALKPMKNFDRYGTVELNSDGSVKNFHEKKFCESGNINGGIYLLNAPVFMQKKWPARFSFEKDFLETGRYRLYGDIQDGYFIDIGVPGDYNRSQEELAALPLDLRHVDKSWTLFLDRDGVINVDKHGSYIFTPDEFVFTEGGPGLFRKLAAVFGHIVIVTNQRGVGRGLMTEEALQLIHRKMVNEIEQAGGRIDGIYYCTAVNNDYPQRKPNPGMAWQAKRDIPSIDMAKSIMVGNNLSDMQFGRNAGMYTVFIRSTRPEQGAHADIDMAFENLGEFANSL